MKNNIEKNTGALTEITKKLYISPMRDRNEKLYGCDGCICCMRQITNEDSYWIHINIDMDALLPNVVTYENCEELTGSESLGCFPIGNDCAKKMKGFVFKYL